ncbi:MAG: type VI secretion system contractile sheath small subunit [Desulfobacteraceae bacterium]|nr:MAG: type VI secretion system contractile sheath small subunit [Desulfobacteraceae bacterium]
MAESIQKKISRVRPPRVHITYDVEVGDAIVKKEIPFVVGVMADLSGKPEEPLPEVKDRKFVEIDRDNFDNVLEGMKPRLAFKVDNKLTNDGSVLPLELKFKSLNDFHPERVAEQVQPLAKLVDARKKLFDLLSKLDGNDSLSALLQEAVAGTDSIAKLGEQAGVKKEEENKPAS